MICGVPQGSILGSLLFLLYVMDLKNASSVLYLIMFADETNLFYSNSKIQKLFSTVKEEPASINQWFTSNKLSLNATKTKYSFFNKPSKKDDISFMLPKLTVSWLSCYWEARIYWISRSTTGWKPELERTYQIYRTQNNRKCRTTL